MTAEIESIRQLIAAHPGLSRRRLSAKLCQAWNWVQANGQLRDMVARSLMLQLHRAGLIVLPAKRKSVPNNAARHRAPLLEPSLPPTTLKPPRAKTSGKAACGPKALGCTSGSR